MKKPRIAWVIDRLGWAQDRRGLSLAKHLDDFDIRVLTMREFCRRPLNHDYDAAVFASWRTVKNQMAEVASFGHERCAAGVGSHYEIGPDLHSLARGSNPDNALRSAVDTLNRFGLVLAHSELLWNMLRKDVPQCRYAPHGVDADYFQPAGDRTDVLPYMVGWLGREKAAKNLCLLQEINTHLALHPVKDVALRFQIIGRNHAVLFSQEMVRHTYQWQWDFSLNVSHSEGMSNVLLESAACGVPAITVDVGDHCKLVKEGQTGFIIEPTIKSAVTCIERLQHLEPHEYRRMSHNIRLVIEAEWTWESRAEAYRKALETLCG